MRNIQVYDSMIHDIIVLLHTAAELQPPIGTNLLKEKYIPHRVASHWLEFKNSNNNNKNRHTLEGIYQCFFSRASFAFH